MIQNSAGRVSVVRKAGQLCHSKFHGPVSHSFADALPHFDVTGPRLSRDAVRENEFLARALTGRSVSFCRYWFHDWFRVPFLGLFPRKNGTVPFLGLFRFWDCSDIEMVDLDLLGPAYMLTGCGNEPSRLKAVKRGNHGLAVQATKLDKGFDGWKGTVGGAVGTFCQPEKNELVSRFTDLAFRSPCERVKTHATSSPRAFA